MVTLKRPKCTSCLYWPINKKIRAVLRRAGVPKNELALCEEQHSCSHRDACPALLFNARLLYDTLPAEHSQRTMQLVTKMLDEDEVLHDSFHPKTSFKNSFYCPELKITMYQPCSVTSCSFHTNNYWCRNCILVYLIKHGSNEHRAKKRTYLSYNELTFLLNMPTSLLRSRLSNALKKLRSGALKTQILKSSETGLISRVLVQGVCPVCETRVPKSLPTRVVKKRLTYCSPRCLEFKPPRVISLENEFNFPIERILEFCVDNFSSTSLMASALRVSHPTFLGFCKTYGIEVQASKVDAASAST